MSTLDEIREAVVAGNAKKARAGTERAAAEGLEAETILSEALIRGMAGEIGADGYAADAASAVDTVAELIAR